MKKYLLQGGFWYLIITSIAPLLCSAQNGSQSMRTTRDTSVHAKVKDTTVLHWLRSLYDPGVQEINDSIIFNDEAKRVFSDEQYRKLIYPANYNWDTAKYFIQTQHLQQAFWYFINLYMINDKNKELVVKAMLTYDKIFRADKILVSTFYTYCFTDPEIAKMDGGQPKVYAPQIIEKKLNAVKEILYYLDKYNPKDRKVDAVKN